MKDVFYQKVCFSKVCFLKGVFFKRCVYERCVIIKRYVFEHTFLNKCVFLIKGVFTEHIFP